MEYAADGALASAPPSQAGAWLGERIKRRQRLRRAHRRARSAGLHDAATTSITWTKATTTCLPAAANRQRALGRHGSRGSVFMVRLARSSTARSTTRLDDALRPRFPLGGISGLSMAFWSTDRHPCAHFSYPLACCEWGLVQWYALVMVAGLLGFVVYYVWTVRRRLRMSAHEMVLSRF